MTAMVLDLVLEHASSGHPAVRAWPGGGKRARGASGSNNFDFGQIHFTEAQFVAFDEVADIGGLEVK